MLQELDTRLRRAAFLTTPLSVVINPYHIARHGLFKAITQMAPAIKGDILDFGCGSKPYESLFKNATSYVGVDVETSGHDHKDSKADFFYDGKKLPFPDNRFDAVVCFEVLEHVFNIEAVLGEIRRVLKPGGQFLLSIPFVWDEHEAPYDFARYTSYGIRHVLKANGFEVMELRKTTTYVLAASQMFIAYLAQHALPQGRIIRRLSQLFIIFPLTIWSLALNVLLPKSYESFCNSVVLCRKVAGQKDAVGSPP